MKITVITVTLNNAATIGDTISSVMGQTHRDIEHIVIDGMSGDSSMETIMAWQRREAQRIRVVQERDTGIYNAINKGMRLATGVDWPMTLFVPVGRQQEATALVDGNPNITIVTFNPVGAEGFGWFTRLVYRLNLAMPRPRNVLIPALMTAIGIGYQNVYIVGADHSWMKTIDVNSDNEVVSVQPHFYKEREEEKARVTNEYRGYRLHDIIASFYVAFKAYHDIRRYADSRGVTVYNSTPSSFIDAFPRRGLPEA